MGIDVHKKLASPDVVDLDLDTFAEAVAEGAVTVVDVREPHEFSAGHIPGAVNLPLSGSTPPTCPRAASGRSSSSVRRARARATRSIRPAPPARERISKHYPGGMSQWRMYGGDVDV